MVKTVFPMQGTWAQPLSRKLRSHMHVTWPLKKKKKKDTIKVKKRKKIGKVSNNYFLC